LFLRACRERVSRNDEQVAGQHACMHVNAKQSEAPPRAAFESAAAFGKRDGPFNASAEGAQLLEDAVVLARSLRLVEYISPNFLFASSSVV
jgi:hypothetical protein